jgi:hypothetical protein
MWSACALFVTIAGMSANGSSPEITFQPSAGIHRRRLLQGAFASALGAPLLGGLARGDAAPAAPPPPVNGSATSPAATIKAILGTPVGYQPYIHGDTWNPTWADDDNLYTIACDTLGNAQYPTNSNLAVYKFTDGPPPNIKVELVNSMPQFGKCTEVSPKDNCCWKGSSMICVDGVLYLAAARNHYGIPSPEAYQIQQAWDSVIIKSSDHGKTWSDVPPIGQSMFPGRNFGNPAFVQYGKDGAAGPHGSDKYIYAVSNDGSWNNGNTMVLGRVPRDKIGDLKASDWEFVGDFTKDYQPVWSPRHDTAAFVFRAPGQAGSCGMAYLPGLNLYVLPQWHYPSLNQWPEEIKWSWSRFQLYSAPSPWGPWSLFHTLDWQPQGFYNPAVLPKFTSADGKSFQMICAGDFSTPDHPYYGVNMISATLEAV